MLWISEASAPFLPGNLTRLGINPDLHFGFAAIYLGRAFGSAAHANPKFKKRNTRAQHNA
jgi:hypothetical protein